MKLYQVDAFTNRPFSGNPAAVCLVEEGVSDKLMQQIAMEMNLSETAFVHVREDKTCHLRWFTPASEVELCGHATLATAHVLFEQQFFSAQEPILFDTLSGRLVVTKQGDELVMDFPAIGQQVCDITDNMVQALQTKAVFCGKTLGASTQGNLGDISTDYLIEVVDEETLRQLKPDFSRLRKEKAKGFVVTAPASSGSSYDFVSRFFAPKIGIDEDPVTGFAHCILAPYWGKKLGKTVLKAYQASERGGELGLSLHGERVHIRGKAITILEGKLLPVVSSLRGISQ